MYTESPGRDLLLFVRAVVTNQLARSHLYMRMAGRTGRATGEETPDELVVYFRGCVKDYLEQLGADESFLRGKRVLEYGPGDTLGVALLLYALGAQSVHCVDRFPLHRMSDHSRRTYQAIIEALGGQPRERARSAFDPARGLDPSVIEYRVTPDGVSGRAGAYDLVISRSVLGLVNRLDRTFADIAAALAPGGVSVHKVDLSSHGLDRYRPLDFLSWPDPLYHLMYSRKGRPNRWRADKYQQLARDAGLRIRSITPTGRVPQEQLEPLRAKLPPQFQQVDPELLSWLGFWMVLERP